MERNSKSTRELNYDEDGRCGAASWPSDQSDMVSGDAEGEEVPAHRVVEKTRP